MNDVLEVSLAAFLHDWGKLFQRAERPLSRQAERMTEMICPTWQGRSSHRHVLWTNDFLEHHLEWLPKELDRSRVIGLASRHHRPSEDLDWLIAEADRLASGHDRREQSDGGTHFKKVPLVSALGRLRLREGVNKPPGALIPGEWCADDSIYPELERGSESLVPEYQAVAEGFTQQLDTLRDPGVSRVCDTAIEVSERWLTTTPASTLDATPDVSLHDHSYLSAAFAAALFVYHRDTDSMRESAIRDRGASKFLLLSGDLSGIQSHLFDLPAESRKGIARTYRARSFFLSLLTHAATVRLLNAVGLPSFNRVLDAGGRFILLLPNTKRARAAVADVRLDIEKWMLGRYSGRLTLNVDRGLTASGGDFIGETFGSLFRKVQRAAETAKRRRFAAGLRAGPGWAIDRQKLDYVHTIERQEHLLNQDRQLGAVLPQSAYVGLWADRSPRGKIDSPLELLGFAMQLFDALPDSRDIGEAADFFRIRFTGQEGPVIRTRPAAAYIPRLSPEDVAVLTTGRSAIDTDEVGEDEEERIEPNRVATFQHLATFARRPPADPSRKPSGLTAIACLKADVDRLGMLFSHGCGEDISFGRVATLSRQLDFFFKAYLTQRFATADGAYRHVYTIFAGGDDLMVIAPWPVLFDLAGELRAWFRRLTGDNPDVTLSAGLALGSGRMPVSSLAAVAEQRLEEAKNAGRDRIGVFGRALTWADYDKALITGRRLDRMIAEGDNRKMLRLRPGFAYRLLQYARNAERVDVARNTEQLVTAGERVPANTLRLSDLHDELTWRSHLSYDLHRNVRRNLPKHVSESVLADLEWLESFLVIPIQSSSGQLAQILRLAASYALYRNRGG